MRRSDGRRGAAVVAPVTPLPIEEPRTPWRDIAPNTLVVGDEVVRDPKAYRSEYQDGIWDLSPLGLADGQGSALLYFTQPQRGNQVVLPPETYIAVSKRIAYLLINDGMPTAYVNRFGTAARARIAPGSIKAAMRNVRDLFWWLHEHGIEHLADCSVQTLNEYALWVTAEKPTPRRAYQLLHEVERLHFLAPLLPEADRLAKPPFQPKDVLTSAGPAAGSARRMILPAVGDPLLTFAISCVRSLAVDILPAYDTVVAMLAAPPEPTNGSVELLRMLADQGGIPGWRRASGFAEVELAADYLGAVYGHNKRSLSGTLNRLGLQEALDPSLPRPVPVPIVGRIGDVAWADFIDWYEVMPSKYGKQLRAPSLVRHLQVACWIVLADLSGARPEEVRQLPRNPHEVVESRGGFGPVRHLMWGTRRKAVTDEQGRASLSGVDKRWVISGPAVDAVAVAEEIAARIAPDSPHLFAGPDGGAIKSDTLKGRVEEFVAWGNDLMTKRGMPAGFLIDSDPGMGAPPTALGSYRRSMAHFMHKRPRGEIATGFQFGQQRELLSGNYANTSDVGYRQVASQAQREAHEEMLTEVSDMLVGGTHLSGPAANRLVGITAEMLADVQASFVSEREVTVLLQQATVPVFDNPGTYSLCMYDPRLAKCLPPVDVDKADEPDRGACDSSCACILRTDAQADRLLQEADEDIRRAENPLTPQPLAVRLRGSAQRKRERAEEHKQRGVFVSIETLRESLVSGSAVLAPDVRGVEEPAGSAQVEREV